MEASVYVRRRWTDGVWPENDVVLRGMAFYLRDDEPTQLVVRGRLAERVIVRSEDRNLVA